MNASTATGAVDDGHSAAFEFVKALAFELSSGKIDLPSFPDVAVRVRRALAEDRFYLFTLIETPRRLGTPAPTAAAMAVRAPVAGVVRRRAVMPVAADRLRAAA